MDLSEKLFKELSNFQLSDTKTQFYDDLMYLLGFLNELKLIENEEYENIDIRISKAFGYAVYEA